MKIMLAGDTHGNINHLFLDRFVFEQQLRHLIVAEKYGISWIQYAHG